MGSVGKWGSYASGYMTVYDPSKHDAAHPNPQSAPCLIAFPKPTRPADSSKPSDGFGLGATWS